MPAPPTPTLGFHVAGAGLLGLSGTGRRRYGFAVDGQVEIDVPYRVGLAAGVGFERFETGRGPLTGMFAEVRAQRHAFLGPFFGLGFGAAFVNQTVHPAVRMTAGIEPFHGGPLPIQAGIDVIGTWCDDEAARDCGATQARTYVAARLGLRL